MNLQMIIKKESLILDKTKICGVILNKLETIMITLIIFLMR